MANQVSADAIKEALRYKTITDPTGQSSYAITGPRCLFYAGDFLIGWGREWSLTVETAFEPMQVVGMFEPLEYTPVGYTISLTVSIFRLLQYPLHKMLDKQAGIGIVPRLNSASPDELKNWILSIPEMDIELYTFDPQSQQRYKKIGSVKRAKFGRMDTRFGVREFVIYNVSFNAIYFVEGED